MAWIQFTVCDGKCQAVVSAKANDLELALKGRAQIEVADGLDGTRYDVDVTQFPPRLIPRSSKTAGKKRRSKPAE